MRCAEVDDGDGEHESESRGGRTAGPPDVRLVRSGTQQLAQVQRLFTSRQRQDGHAVGRLS